MDFVNAIKSGYKGYVNFSGRATRSQFWYWALFQIVISVIIAFVEGGGHSEVVAGAVNATYSAGPIALVWALLNLLPGIAVGIRRLHDIDKSGWWVLIILVPIVGIIVLLVWDCQKGTVGNNRFGADLLA